MAPDPTVIALSRFGLGPRPGDTGRLAADPKGAVLAELQPDLALIKAPLPGTADLLTDLANLRAEKKAARNGTPKSDASGAPAMEMQPPADPKRNPVVAGSMEKPVKAYTAEFAVRMERANAMPVGYIERLVSFWANHFAVAAGAGQVERALVGAYEREAIRPHVLGKFSDMLVAVTRHAAMLQYLNNAQSVGPNSPIGQRLDRGINENHARELMELHTIGVDAGYTQADVIALADALTGWSISRGNADRAPIGSFRFRAAGHEPGPRTILGKVYDQGGEKQGMAVLMDLARNPDTAQHIAIKLARHFVADDPPPSLVSTLATTFSDSGGDLMKVSRALVASEEAWQGDGKFRTPQQFLIASTRALGVNPKPRAALEVLRTLGQMPWDPPSPAGFDDTAATWLAPDAMTTRLDVSEQIAGLAHAAVDPPSLLADLTANGASAATTEAVAHAESKEQALALMLMSPELQRS